MFLDWADALKQAGIREVRGRLIGDDNAFDDGGIGAGWAWDYLTDDYAAPSGALSYNENVVTYRIAPGKAEGDPAAVTSAPAGATFTVDQQRTDGRCGLQCQRVARSHARQHRRSSFPAASLRAAQRCRARRRSTIRRAISSKRLRLALESRGIRVSEGAVDIDDAKSVAPADGRRLVARRESAPLSALGAHFLKVSQNFYGEMFLKTIGRAPGRAGTAATGRAMPCARRSAPGASARTRSS